MLEYIVMIENKIKKRLPPSLQILLGFLIIIMLGAFLLTLPIANNNGLWLGFVDSFFTSTSAVCVTGLAVVDTAVQFTLFGQIVILFLIQIGGLGTIVITSFIFLMLKKKINFSNRMALKEGLNRDTIQGIVKYLKRVILLTFIIEGIGALCLLYSTITYFGSFSKGLFSAVFMSISSFCNAGFDVFGNETMQFASLYPFAGNVLMQLPIMMLIILGGIGFAILIDGWKNVRSNQHVKIVLVITGILIFAGAIIFMLAEWNNPETLGNMSVGEKILNSFFQSITTRTAGASTINQSGLTFIGGVTTILLMFVGGAPTSTAGGIKVTTLFLIFVIMFRRCNGNGNIIFKNRKISAKIINKTIKIVMYYLLILIVSIVIVGLIEEKNLSIIQVIFECVSAMSTVGLSMNVTPLLTNISKIIVALLMFVGRVGMTTIVISLSSKSNQIQDQVEYINTDIIVG